MAPKEPFKVHSLSKHIEDTKKGLSAEAQYNKRPIGKSKASFKREPGTIDKAIFGNESEDDDSGSSSSGSSDEDGSDFLRKLQASKTSTNATPKKRVKREEIADSDDERRSTAKNVTSVKSKQLVQSGAPSSDDSSSESESESGYGAKLKSTKGEQKVRANGAPLKTVAPSSSGSSSDSDSQEEEGDESSSDEKPPKEATAAKVKESTSSDQESSDNASDEESDEESDDESEPAASAKPKPAITSTNGTSTATTSETSSSDEGTDDEDKTAAQAKPVATGKSVPDESSDDASEESSEEEDADVSMHIADRQHDRRATVPDFIAPDFVLRKSDGGTNGQDVARICSQANLQGKQVWYFTVPANVPISVVQNMEIPMNQSQSGDSIFSHNGEDYGISVDSMTPKSSIQILIPSSDGTRYRSASRPIDQVMQVKKITQLGQGLGATSSVGPTPKPPARQQPEGLKARYQPYGVTSPMGQIGVDVSFRVEDDTEMADTPAPAPAIPSSSPQSKSDKKEKKRKEKENGESKTPRKGKRKHISSEDDAVAATEQLMEENLSAETKTKKQKTERVGSPDLGSDAPPSSVSKKQTLLVPPAIPGSTPSSKSKSNKSKPETPAPKPRQTAVPVPQVPGSSQLKVSPVPLPQPGVASTPLAERDNKKSKKKKTKTPDATAKTQQSPPPSAQAAGKNSKITVTPVPMPKLKTTG
ncbi:hypothetical protein J3459_018449 [Metarhizium acridum]|nr:hypothetical protein J3459_018449 [Metarhizium acridum]